jgi:hypothetical protein
MNFTNKRYAPYTDEYRQPQNGQWNGHGVYDNEKNCKVYFKDWDESKKSYAEAVAKAIEMNNQIK